MDLSEFDSRTFDAKKWINQKFKGNKEDDSKETSVSMYIVQLQSCGQQLNKDIEIVSQQVVNNLPRIIRDTEILTEEALVLKEKMDSVKQEIAKVEKNTGQSIESLEKIDQVKLQLQKAIQTLQEADNWTILGTDVEAAFMSLKQLPPTIQDFDSIAMKLVSMQQSLNVLVNSRDYDSKKLQLKALKDRLEELMSPLLIQAFNSKIIEPSMKMVKIFIEIDRLGQVKKIYSVTQKDYLTQQWDDVPKIDTQAGVMEGIKGFYDAVVLNWREQLKWCEQVFPNFDCSTLCQINTDVLFDLSVTITAFIDSALSKVPDEIVFLTLLKNQAKNFADNIQLITDKMVFADKTKLLFQLGRAIYQPYVTYISKYGLLEQKRLLRLSDNLKTNSEDLIDMISAITSLNEKALSLATDAKKRCLGFTEGASLAGLCKALEQFFNKYVNIYQVILKESNTKRTQLVDFNIFQICLMFLQSLGEMKNSLQELESDVIKSLTDFHTHCNKSDIHAFTKWDKILLNKSSQEEFVVIYNTTIKRNEPLFKTTSGTLQHLCKNIHQTTFSVIFTPIAQQLELVKSAPTWVQPSMSSDLPDYSIVPQEYITQIGQYLMTLPQHLEPFLATENPAISTALRLICDSEIEAENISFAELFLRNISDSTCKNYCDSILTIDELSQYSCKQIATDIDYLGNVLEDLGFGLSNNLKNITLLLRLPPAEYASKSAGCNLQLKSAIRRMRNITLE